MKRKSKIEKLAEALDFRTESEYFAYCIESHINGNFSQCKELFNDMNKAGKKELLMFIRVVDAANDVYDFYFNLL